MELRMLFSDLGSRTGSYVVPFVSCSGKGL